MANLISSRQIQGVVTASKVTGEFEVSGSSHITGSFNVTGSITSTSTITGNNFVGSGTTLTGVELAGRGIISGSEQLPGGLISSSQQLPAGLVSGAAQLTTEFDARYGNELGDGLISGSVLRPGGDGVISGSSQIEFGNINNLPAGIVSGSIQILGSSDVRIIRDGNIIFTGKIGTLFREKNQVKQVSVGQECGITVKDYMDFQKNDIIEAFNITSKERSI